MKGAARRRLSALACDRTGSTAVEFSLLGVVLVAMMLGIIQFSLVFVSGLQLRSALSEAAGSANNPLYTQYRDKAQVTTKLCAGLMLVDSCSTALKLEQMPVRTLGSTYQPITGTTYYQGLTNDLLVMRALAPVVTFVPGVPQLYVKATAVWLNK